MGNEEPFISGNSSVFFLFSQCLNRPKTPKQCYHPIAQKETSNSTDIASQNRRTKRPSDSRNWPIKYKSTEWLSQAKIFSDVCWTEYVDMTRSGVRKVFMNGFWKLGKISKGLETHLFQPSFRYEKIFVWKKNFWKYWYIYPGKGLVSSVR